MFLVIKIRLKFRIRLYPNFETFCFSNYKNK